MAMLDKLETVAGGTVVEGLQTFLADVPADAEELARDRCRAYTGRWRSDFPTHGLTAQCEAGHAAARQYLAGTAPRTLLRPAA